MNQAISALFFRSESSKISSLVDVNQVILAFLVEVNRKFRITYELNLFLPKSLTLYKFIFLIIESFDAQKDT